MSDNAESEADEETEADVEEDVARDVEDEAAEEVEDEAGQGAEDAEDGEATDGFSEGDFAKLEYTARTVDDDQLVDTTDREVAEEAGVAEDQDFGARTIVLGEGHLFEIVEEDIYGQSVGDGGSVVVPAEDAFGEYDQDQVRTISKDKIPEDDRYPGAHVDVDGETGHVETIIGGRARVDFNHALAGEDIEYDYEIVGEVDDREEQAQGLIEMLLDVELDVWFETETEEEERLVEPDEDEVAEGDEAEEAEGDEAEGEDEEAEDEEPPEPETEVVEVEKETLYIEAIPQLSMNQQWMMGKQQIADQLIDLLGVDRVIVQETLEGMGAMGMPGMMGGAGGGGGGGLEEALEDADVDAEELAEELEGAQE